MNVNSLLVELFFSCFALLGRIPAAISGLDTRTSVALAAILDVSTEMRVIPTLSCVRIITDLMYDTFLKKGMGAIFSTDSLLYTSTCVVLSELGEELVT
jgi:hypothetical protein